MKVFYSARTQFENLGDRGIATSLLNEFSQYSEIHVLTKGCPLDYIDQLKRIENIKVYPSGIKFLYNLTASSFRKSRTYFLMKPGHFFGTDGGITLRLVQLIILTLLRIQDVRILRLGASIGPFSKKIDIIEALAYKLYHIYSVRERFSYDYTKKIGCKNVILFPDIGFLFTTSILAPSSSNEIKIDDSLITLSFRRFKTIESENNFNYFISHLNTRVDEKQLRTCIQVDLDRSYMLEVNKLINQHDFEKVVNWTTNGAEKLFELYSRSDIVISNRLHVLLFSATLGALPIALIDPKHDLKIYGIFIDNGLNDLVIDITKPEIFLQSLDFIMRSKLRLKELTTTAIIKNKKYISNEIRRIANEL